MSFFQSIEKLRNKSEQERRAISLTGASMIFLVIFFVWLTTFQLNSGQIKNEEAQNTLSPLDSLKNISSRFVQDMKEKVGGSDQDDDSLNSILESQTESAATHTGATNFLNENMATTTKNNFLDNAEENETLFGTSSDMTQSATSSGEIEDIVGDEEENPPTGGE